MEDLPTCKPSLRSMKLPRCTLMYQRKFEHDEHSEADPNDRWESFFLSLSAARAGGGLRGVREFWAERPITLADFTNQQADFEHFRRYVIAHDEDGYRQG